MQYPAIGRDLNQLVDTQLWCFGQDIRHPDGNLLVRYGFIRHPAPDGAPGCTAYALQHETAPHRIAPGVQLVVWGFALFFGSSPAQAGVLVHRHRQVAGLTACPQVPLPLPRIGLLPPAAVPRSTHATRTRAALLADAARACEAYEQWIVGERGAAYRACCLDLRPRSKRRNDGTRSEAIHRLSAGWADLSQFTAGTSTLPHLEYAS